jgi:sialic acid synthase SpsE
LNLPYEYYLKAKKICDKNKIKFGIALADETLIDFFENIDVDFYKILSKDIGNISLLSKLGKTEKKLFLSTGLSGIHEIEKGLKSIDNFKEKTTIIHTQLSHSIDHVNLKSIPFLQQTFTMPVGYGHHSVNPNVLYLALVFNPSAIFFYVKGDKLISHPDEEHSIMLNQLSDVVKNLNQLPKCFGSYSKSKIDAKIKNMK